MVVGNYIGTDLSGLHAPGNGRNGVLIDGSASCTIGQTSTNGRYNIISGNTLDGVHIDGTSSTLNTVCGNIIGLDLCGCNIVANGGDGVHIVNAPTNPVGGRATQGEGNVISGNTEAGVEIGGSSAASNKILGNLIGTAVDGLTPRGNITNGICISSASQTQVGGIRCHCHENLIPGGLGALGSSRPGG